MDYHAPDTHAESRRIAQYFAPLAQGEKGAQNLVNDAAALEIPAHKKLIITTDSAVEGVHLPRGCTLAQLARKGMRRNLSDLAAMGASPWRYSFNMHLTTGTHDDAIASMVTVLAEEQARFGCILIGGDSTQDDARAHLTFTMLGLCDSDSNSHSRSGAQAGDDIYVSGTIGDGFLGLQEVLGGISSPPCGGRLGGGEVEGSVTLRSPPPHPSPVKGEGVLPNHESRITNHYYAPEPRLALGAALHGIATSCIDISDGLLQDATRIEQASNVKLMIATRAVPLSVEAHAALQQNTVTLQQLITGGDDYELLFTAPKHAAPSLQHIATQQNTRIAKIGSVTSA